MPETFAPMESIMDDQVSAAWQVRMDDLQDQIDRRIATEQRELALHTERLQQAIELREVAMQDRVDRVESAAKERWAALRESIEQRRIAAQEAIAKSEHSMDRRLDLLNEFRAQSAEEAQKYALREGVEARQEEMQTAIEVIRASALPRETYEASLREWTTWRDQVNRRLDQREGQEQAATRTMDRGDRWSIALAGFAGTFAITIVIIVVNILTAH